MDRRVLKNIIRKKGITASTYRPRSSNVKKIPSQDLSDRFAKMRLTPASSQSDVMQILGTKVTKQRRRRRRSPNKEDVDKFAKESANSHSHADGRAAEVFPPPIPRMVYEWIKDVAEITKNPNWSSDFNSFRNVIEAENGIRVACRCFHKSMPIGWKYEQEHAESLIVGYDKVFSHDGYYWII